MSMAWAGRLREARASEAPPDILRLGVECSDGSRASTLETPYLLSLTAEDPPPERVIWGMGGSAGGNRSEQHYSVWPLPSAGPLTFVCEWPANDVPITRLQVDGTAILEAGADAENALA